MGGMLGSLLFRGWLHLRLVKSERPLQSLKDLALSFTVRHSQPISLSHTRFTGVTRVARGKYH